MTNPALTYNFHVYPQQLDTIDQLLPLHACDHQQPILVIDSCGWHYKRLFPSHNIRTVEGMQRLKHSALDRSLWDHMFDDRDAQNPRFGNLAYKGSCVILDRSVFLKYQNPQQLHAILNAVVTATQCDHLWLRMSMLTCNDDRFQDRVSNMSAITPDQFVTTEININLEHAPYYFCAKYKRYRRIAHVVH